MSLIHILDSFLIYKCNNSLVTAGIFMKDPIDIFSDAIGNKTRFKILGAIVDRPLSVSKIVKSTRLEQTNVSHNLRYLLDYNFVGKRTIGREHEYFINKEVKPLVKDLMSNLKKHESILKKSGMMTISLMLFLKYQNTESLSILPYFSINMGLLFQDVHGILTQLF